ncbi:MAG: class I SAM-dependent methyltransferase [Planctomycetes bacterium]|nr:class I SAM-dependent methyltransferase [Planctomycetota bacterium]
MTTDPTAAGEIPALVAAAKQLGAELPPDRAERLLRYLDAMLATNEHVNLTAVRDRAQAIVLHVLDSLAFARTGLHPQHLLDLGSGNGFPGVGVAALHPGASVLLMDRTGKKVRAIGGCLVTAGFDGVETVQLDAAQAPTLRRDLRHAFDVVTARAVGRPAELQELADPLLRPGGSLVLWLEADAEVPERLGPFRLERRIAYQLPAPAARERQLGHWRKR